MKGNMVNFWLTIIFLVVVMFAFGFLWGSSIHYKIYHTYPKITTVYSISEAKDEVIVIDCAGELWSFNGVENWKIGDTCNCIMFDNCTDSIQDDEIIIHKKDAWYQSVK